MKQVDKEHLSIMLVNMTIDAVQGGGTAERTRQLAKYLLQAGCACRLITIVEGFLEASYRKEIAGVEIIAFRSLSRRFHLPLFRPMILWRAIKASDVIHLMNHWTLINAVVFILARLMKKPVVICPAGALRIVGRSRKLKLLYAWIIGDRMIRNAAGVILISENELAHFSQHAPARSVRLIPNGIDPSNFEDTNAMEFRRQFSLPENGPLILYMGRLNFIKGPDILLKAFISIIDRMDDYHLVFVGPDDGMQSELEAISRTAQVTERIHFTGYVGGALKSQAYHASSFLVIPSRQEAMSIVALEAGAAGKPVLLTDACGFDEVGRIGGGVVVKADIEDLAAGLLHMAASAERNVQMGNAMCTHVLSNFSWSKIVNRHIDYFKKIAA